MKCLKLVVSHVSEEQQLDQRHRHFCTPIHALCNCLLVICKGYQVVGLHTLRCRLKSALVGFIALCLSVRNWLTTQGKLVKHQFCCPFYSLSTLYCILMSNCYCVLSDFIDLTTLFYGIIFWSSQWTPPPPVANCLYSSKFPYSPHVTAPMDKKL